MNTLERISQHSFLPWLVRPGSVALDLGGNRGAFAQGVRDRYGLNVILVEPVPALARDLRNNDFDVIEAAVAAHDGTALLTFDPENELSGSVLDSEVIKGSIGRSHTATVAAISLETLVKNRSVDLVKVDIEGAELEMILEASDETLLSVSQFTVEFHDFWYPELSARTELAKRRLQNLGFWMLRGTPNNKDVLFVHPAHKPGLVKRLQIHLVRNANGLGRAFMILWRRLQPPPPPPPPKPRIPDAYFSGHWL